MLKVLVPVDGSSPSKRAIRHVIQLSRAHEPMELHLVNVQEPADAPQLMRFRKKAEITPAQLEHGESVLTPAKRALERAGLHKKEVRGLSITTQASPDFSPHVAEQLGLEVDWVLNGDYGGAGGVMSARRAATAASSAARMRSASCANSRGHLPRS